MRKGSFFDGFLREKGVDIIAGGGGGGVAPVILVQSEYGLSTRRVSTLFTTPEHKATNKDVMNGCCGYLCYQLRIL